MRQNAGFTFLELVVVMTLVSIISAIVIPTFGPAYRTMQVKSTQDEILALIAHTQEMAVRESREFHFCIDPRERIFWVRYVATPQDVDEVEVELDLEGTLLIDVAESWGQEQPFPEFLDMRQPRMRKDRETGAFYLACYPNGACDRVTLQFEDTRFRGDRFVIETLGTLGQFEVERE